MSRGPRRVVSTDEIYDEDYLRCLSRDEDIDGLDLLARGKPLPKGIKPHAVDKDFPGMMDIHAGPDFILIYQLEARALHLHRCGSHAELFPRSRDAVTARGAR
jgi:addiction module RelE/StbE family toxin